MKAIIMITSIADFYKTEQVLRKAQNLILLYSIKQSPKTRYRGFQLHVFELNCMRLPHCANCATICYLKKHMHDKTLVTPF